MTPAMSHICVFVLKHFCTSANTYSYSSDNYFVPPLCACYGTGTGGHLHNLGVVLLREEPPLSSLPASSSSDSSHIQASPAITAAESTTVQPLSSAVATAATSESGTSAVATAATSESSTSVDKRGGIGHEVCVSDFGLAGRLYKLCVTNDLVACGMLNFYQVTLTFFYSCIRMYILHFSFSYFYFNRYVLNFRRHSNFNIQCFSP